MWNGDDVTEIFASQFTPGAERYKYIDLPLSNYASSSYDKVMKGGKVVGLSMFSGISYNEQSMLSLGRRRSGHQGRRPVDAGVGRRERRHEEEHRRAPQADRNPRHRRCRSLRPDGAGDLSAEVIGTRDPGLGFRLSRSQLFMVPPYRRRPDP